MLKKQCWLILKKTNIFPKRIFLTIIALLIAGLFLLYRTNTTTHNSTREAKPSDFNFQNSNHPTEQLIKRQEAQAPTNDEHPINISSLTANDQNKYSILNEIIASHNDNDSRLDREFSHFSPELHQIIIQKYNLLKPEDRSGRGLISYLISRDMNTIEDAEFLKKIFQESPCLSLENCRQLSDDQSHHSGTTATTLAYPQLAVLYQIERQLQSDPDILNNANKRSYFSQILAQAENFEIPSVQNKARSIRQKYGL